MKADGLREQFVVCCLVSEEHSLRFHWSRTPTVHYWAMFLQIFRYSSHFFYSNDISNSQYQVNKLKIIKVIKFFWFFVPLQNDYIGIYWAKVKDKLWLWNGRKVWCWVRLTVVNRRRQWRLRWLTPVGRLSCVICQRP